MTINHHWVQIAHSSYAIIQQLVQSGLARPTDRPLCGVGNAGTWELTAQAEVRIVSDECLTIAGRLVVAQLNHLPAHTYRALVAGSPMFTQYEGLETLYQQIRQPLEGWNPGTFVTLLEETVKNGRRPDLQPRLVVTPEAYTAQWCSTQVYLRQNSKGDWFLALIFDVQHSLGQRHAAPVPMGLDLGLNPMTVACTAAGEYQTFRSVSLDHLRTVPRLDLTSEAQGLLADLAYSSGREDAQQVTEYLNWRASRVYAEDLRLHGMSDSYIQKARISAIHDHHFSHLPQYMHAAGRFFKRVPPHFTSRRCASCYTQSGVDVNGTRHGKNMERLTCPRCHQTYNCHEVASWNIAIIGEERHGPARRR